MAGGLAAAFDAEQGNMVLGTVLELNGYRGETGESLQRGNILPEDLPLMLYRDV